MFHNAPTDAGFLGLWLIFGALAYAVFSSYMVPNHLEHVKRRLDQGFALLIVMTFLGLVSFMLTIMVMCSDSALKEVLYFLGVIEDDRLSDTTPSLEHDLAA